MLAFKGTFREIVICYVVTLLVAAWIAYPYILSGGPVSKGGNEPSTAGIFFAEILLATAILIVIVKIWPWIFQRLIYGLELLFLFISVALLLSDMPAILAMVGGVLAVAIRVLLSESDVVQNISTTIIVGVTTAVVGASLSPVVTVILLVILAVYDYISVFITKHMVVLAKAVAGSAEVGKGTKHLLGAGDVAIPGMFAISLARASITASVLAMAGAVAGLLATTYLARRWKRVLPALPSIGLTELVFALIGFAIQLCC